MGVLGLTSYMRGDEPGERCDLRDCRIVIDGSSLSVQLYRASSARKRAAFNGDYFLIENCFRSFFRSLKRCNIEPYVICDGGYDLRKLKTTLARLRVRTKDAGTIDPKVAETSDLLMLPLMLRDVFFYVMTDMNIKFVVCEREADQEIAIVARYLDAPVLSLDSDFYIYNVSYVPIHSIDIKSPAVVKEGKAVFECDLCRPGDFIDKFKIKLEVLPLLATLLGNDYVKRATFSKFFKNLSFNEKKTRNTLGQCRITAVLQWLRNESFHSALEKILDRFKSTQRHNIQRLILKSCSVYKETRCDSLIDLGLIETFSPQSEPFKNDEFEDDSFDCDDALISDIIKVKRKSSYCSHWLLHLIKKGKLSPRYFEMLQFDLFIGSPQVENTQLEDAHMFSFPIIRYSYDLIKNFSVNTDMTFIGRKSWKVTKVSVKRSVSIPLYLKMKLSHTIQPDHALFSYFLERVISKKILNKIKREHPQLQIILLTIVWIKSQRNSNEFLNINFINSLLLCAIILLIIYDKAGGMENIASFSKKSAILKNSVQINGQSKHNKSFRELNNHDCVIAVSVLSKYFEVNSKISSNLKLYDRKVVHSFAQLLCCFQHLNYLNIITSESFHPGDISKIFHGTFIYNMHIDLCKRNDVDSYIFHLLKQSPSIYNYFISIRNIVNDTRLKKGIYFDMCINLERLISIDFKYIIIFSLFTLLILLYMCYFNK